MQIYSGYGYGQPVYTVKGDQVYQGYGYGQPVYTIKRGQVYQGYGYGQPIYTIKGLADVPAFSHRNGTVGSEPTVL